MSTYIMMGKYSARAYEGISSTRTEQALDLVRKLNGEIKSIHVLLGKYDVHIIADFPSMREAISASVALQKLTAATGRKPVLPVAAAMATPAARCLTRHPPD